MAQKIGPYEVLGELGKGGMGTVYQARHEETGDEVALKILPPTLARDSHFVLRFRREIQTLSQLKHPNIAGIVDQGQDGDIYYYAMEFVDGGSLEDVIKNQGKFDDIHDAIRIVREVAQGLSFAHDKKIIHRDIKPANILMDLAGAVKLTDFGVAKMLEATRMTVTGATIGTAEYMSPEQAEGHAVGSQADIYSLGVLFYRMVTGRLPFTGATAVEIMKHHRFDMPDPPKSYNPEISNNLSAFIERMLAKQPVDRFETMQEFIRELDKVEEQMRLAQGGPDAARQTRRETAAGAGEPVPWGKLIGYSVVLVLIVLFFVWMRARGKRQHSPEQRFERAVTMMKRNDDIQAAKLFEEVIRDSDTSRELKDRAKEKLRTLERKRLRHDFSLIEKNLTLTRGRLMENARRIAAAQGYQQGLAYLETGEIELAQDTFKAVTVLFGDTPWELKCRKRLEAIELGIYETPDDDKIKSATPPDEGGRKKEEEKSSTDTSDSEG